MSPHGDAGRWSSFRSASRIASLCAVRSCNGVKPVCFIVCVTIGLHRECRTVEGVEPCCRRHPLCFTVMYPAGPSGDFAFIPVAVRHADAWSLWGSYAFCVMGCSFTHTHFIAVKSFPTVRSHLCRYVRLSTSREVAFCDGESP